MCKHCEENRFRGPILIFTFYDTTVEVYRGSLIIDGIVEEYQIHYDFEINYCPMCGEKL